MGTSLYKDANLKQKAKDMSSQLENLEEEFFSLVEYVKENVKNEKNIATQGDNREHNRYTDIAPFDDNYVCLKNEVFQGQDEVTYVNASKIVFPSCEQIFLAVQAPKPVSFHHFWHMVVQEKVSVIVMITKLVEKNKRKAHQYWPEDAGEDPLGLVLDIGGGCSVEFVSSSYQGSYFLRTFSVWLPDGGMQKVVQLQTEDWPDLTAPEEPRLLLDLVHKTNDLQEVNRQSGQKAGTILVHCSAGVGRTGTFLAVYKLWLDYMNPNVKELSVFSTVLALRRQRCLMVQKKQQYAYIAKCFSFFVSSEEGDLYEATGEDADLQDN